MEKADRYRIDRSFRGRKKEEYSNKQSLLNSGENNPMFGKTYYDKWVEKYGEEAASWLRELGITANGFSPATTLEKTGEEIFINSLKVKKTDRLWSKFLKKKIIKFRVFHQKNLNRLKKSNKNIAKKTLASKKSKQTK